MIVFTAAGDGFHEAGSAAADDDPLVENHGSPLCLHAQLHARRILQVFAESGLEDPAKWQPTQEDSGRFSPDNLSTLLEAKANGDLADQLLAKCLKKVSLAIIAKGEASPYFVERVRKAFPHCKL